MSSGDHDTDQADRVGLVLSGGGARGAYEAGALAELLPALERSGQLPSIAVGTSVGAINASYFTASTHRDQDEAAAAGLEQWKRLRKDDVVRPIIGRRLPLKLLRHAADVLPLPMHDPVSLLDPTPLEGNLKRWIDWRALHTNLREGALGSLAVVATAARTGRSVCFLEGDLSPASASSHVLDYVSTRLGPSHLAASAAIPLLFPAIRIESPASARGWYFDGGTRLNTPIKPALDLGATRLVVIGTQSLLPRSAASGRYEGEAPDLGVAGLHALHGSLVDPLAEDLRTLANINDFFADPSQAPKAAHYREVRGKAPYRQIPYMFVSPGRAGAIGELASEVIASRYRGLRGLRHPDFPLLSQLFGGTSETKGELLSYILFDPEFIEGLIEMGKADARRWIGNTQDGAVRWQLSPLDSVFNGALPKRGEVTNAPA